jgi:hypothetical protein
MRSFEQRRVVGLPRKNHTSNRISVDGATLRGAVRQSPFPGEPLMRRGGATIDEIVEHPRARYNEEV